MQHQIASREEWFAARLGLLKEEKEHHNATPSSSCS